VSPDLLTTFGSPIHPPDIGELWMQRHQPDDTHPAEWITINRADPRILISGVIMEEIIAGQMIGTTTYDTPTGPVVKIEADNQTVIYRIVDRWPQSYVYVAEWPD